VRRLDRANRRAIRIPKPAYAGQNSLHEKSYRSHGIRRDRQYLRLFSAYQSPISRSAVPDLDIAWDLAALA
jgi:hypothetical protein